MGQTAVAARNARNACHARGVASLRTAVGVAGASARICDTTLAVVAGLGGRTRRNTGAAGGIARQALVGITGSRQTLRAADVRAVTTSATETGLNRGTANAVAAQTRATGVHPTIASCRRTRCYALAVLAVLARGTAMCAGVTGAIAAGVLHTAD
jgi:hypothetical protein